MDNAKRDISTGGYEDVNSTHSFHTVVFHLPYIILLATSDIFYCYGVAKTTVHISVNVTYTQLKSTVVTQNKTLIKLRNITHSVTKSVYFNRNLHNTVRILAHVMIDYEKVQCFNGT